MERILNEEDKLKRAEEIYYRRNNRVLNYENKDKKTKNSFWLNILIMFNLTIIVFCIQNKDFIFTEEFLGELNKYNTEVSGKIINFFKEIISEKEITNDTTENANKNIESINSTVNINKNGIENEESLENEKEKKYNENDIENNIESTNETNKLESLSSTLDEMEEDVKNLKVAYSFINPLTRCCKF